MARQIIFHVGAGKTGSSAIQSGLARHNDELLNKYNIFYPLNKDAIEAANGKVTSGNAAEIYQYVCPERRQSSFSEIDFFKNLSMELDGCEFEKCIFSNELLEEGNKEKWIDLVEFLQGKGLSVTVVYYTRHLVDHACSVHGQMIKRSGYSESFGEYSHHYKPKFKRNLDKFIDVLGQENLIVKVYDDVKEDILADFLSSIKSDVFLPSQVETVNRSMSNIELLLLKELNRQSADPGVYSGPHWQDTFPTEFKLQSSPHSQLNSAALLPLARELPRSPVTP